MMLKLVQMNNKMFLMLSDQVKLLLLLSNQVNVLAKLRLVVIIHALKI
jgi:hypothetical protein